MLDRIVARAGAAGLQRYEVSAFARDTHRCRHNLNYWMFGDYLGIGAGAHSKLSFPHRVVRQQRWREPMSYMTQALDGHALSQDEEVARAELPFEFMLNALRLREGVEMKLFNERTGLPASAIDAALRQAQTRGLLQAHPAQTGSLQTGPEQAGLLGSGPIPDTAHRARFRFPQRLAIAVSAAAWQAHAACAADGRPRAAPRVRMTAVFAA